MIQYSIKRLNLLLTYNIKPIMIFDGGQLPIKSKTDDKRHKLRYESRLKAKEYFNMGNYELARRKYAESIDITPAIAHELIVQLKKIGVEYYVSPYEADAQLMYMWKEGFADVIITEDSDLLVYGCEKVFFKMDNKGYGYEINIRNIGLIPSFQSFTKDDFVNTCILSGCDYLESVKGIGLK